MVDVSVEVKDGCICIYNDSNKFWSTIPVSSILFVNMQLLKGKKMVHQIWIALNGEEYPFVLDFYNKDEVLSIYAKIQKEIAHCRKNTEGK